MLKLHWIAPNIHMLCFKCLQDLYNVPSSISIVAHLHDFIHLAKELLVPLIFSTVCIFLFVPISTFYYFFSSTYSDLLCLSLSSFLYGINIYFILDLSPPEINSKGYTFSSKELL